MEPISRSWARPSHLKLSQSVRADAATWHGYLGDLNEPLAADTLMSLCRVMFRGAGHLFLVPAAPTGRVIADIIVRDGDVRRTVADVDYVRAENTFISIVKRVVS